MSDIELANDLNSGTVLIDLIMLKIKCTSDVCYESNLLTIVK